MEEEKRKEEEKGERRERMKGGKGGGNRDREKGRLNLLQVLENCAWYGLEEQKSITWNCLSEGLQETSLPSASLC